MEVRSGLASLEQECVSARVVREQTNCTVTVPELQRGRLVLALVVRPLDLQHAVARRHDVRDVAVRERILESKVPLRRALLDESREALLPVSI
jgi:hypothetical protein